MSTRASYRMVSIITTARGRFGAARATVGGHFMRAAILISAWAVVFAVTASTLASTEFLGTARDSLLIEYAPCAVAFFFADRSMTA